MQTSTVLQATNGSSKHIKQATFQDMVDGWLRHHEAAVQFMRDILFVAARWDDLIDKDTILLDSDIHQLMEVALSLPCNPFYMQHFAALHTLLHNSVRNWKVANQLERDTTSDETDFINAFILRASYIDLISHCAMLIGGNTWGEHVAKEARTNNAKEGFAAYLRDLKREHTVAKEQPYGVRE